MVRKQILVAGGLRKSVLIPDSQNAGTVITGYGGQSLSVAQLKSLLGVSTVPPNTQIPTGGTPTVITVQGRPGRIAFMAPDEDEGGGGAAPPGKRGKDGAIGPQGPAGTPGGPRGYPIALIVEPEEPPTPTPVRGARGNQGTPGPAGISGSHGPAVFFISEEPETDYAPLPGRRGPAGGDGALVEIGQVILGSNAPTVTFSSIPAIYTNLRLVCLLA